MCPARVDRFSTRQQGFTLLELVVALVIAGILFAIATPSLNALGEGMRYRGAVSDLIKSIDQARRDALRTGIPVDLIIDAPNYTFQLAPEGELDLGTGWQSLPDELSINVVYAAEVSPKAGVAAIRFYPDGGSSGGEIDLVRATGGGVSLHVDWLLGDVAQMPMSD